MDSDISPAAQAANRRLYELRKQLAAEQGGASRRLTDEHQPSIINSHSLQTSEALAAATDHTAALQLVPARPSSCLQASTSRPPAILHNRPVDALSVGEAPATVERVPTGRINTPSHSESIATLANHISSLPPHLGWGSQTLTAHLRQRNKGQGANTARRDQWDSGLWAVADARRLPPIGPTPSSSSSAQSAKSADFPSPSLIKVYPAIALGMLREERTAAGRLWLLLRYLDAPGRGIVTLDDARSALCDKASPLRLCGWRRLRQLLAEGESLFWTRERGRERRPASDHRPLTTDRRPPTIDRLRLHGPARVAAVLDVRRLVGRPVGLPPSALLGPIGEARAHLYATFHSGRATEDTRYEIRNTSQEDAPHSYLVSRISYLGSPIARDTLAKLSGVCARSQIAYERRVGVTSQTNIALGERVAATPGTPIGPAEQECAWQQGRALFRLRDHRGHHGRPGATYLAWRLPNAYGPARGHQPRPKGRQKRINRRLADLFTKGMTGNDERIAKRFYPTAAGAVKAAERGAGEKGSGLTTGHSPLTTRHWPTGRPGRGGHCRVWATVAGKNHPAARPRSRLKSFDPPTIDTSSGNLLKQVSAASGGFQSAGRR